MNRELSLNSIDLLILISRRESLCVTQVPTFLALRLFMPPEMLPFIRLRVAIKS